MSSKFTKQQSEDHYKAHLSPEAFKVLRQNGTEYPFTGVYDKHFETGSYHCAACNTQLFESAHKYNSGCGWPAFDTAISGAILYIEDHSHGMRRVETVVLHAIHIWGMFLKTALWTLPENDTA